jgi:hypothetical protein
MTTCFSSASWVCGRARPNNFVRLLIRPSLRDLCDESMRVFPGFRRLRCYTPGYHKVVPMGLRNHSSNSMNSADSIHALRLTIHIRSGAHSPLGPATHKARISLCPVTAIQILQMVGHAISRKAVGKISTKKNKFGYELARIYSIRQRRSSRQTDS